MGLSNCLFLFADNELTWHRITVAWLVSHSELAQTQQMLALNIKSVCVDTVLGLRLSTAGCISPLFMPQGSVSPGLFPYDVMGLKMADLAFMYLMNLISAI